MSRTTPATIVTFLEIVKYKMKSIQNRFEAVMNQIWFIDSSPVCSGGLLFVMPTCAGWIWLSRGSTCRGLVTQFNHILTFGPPGVTSCCFFRVGEHGLLIGKMFYCLS